MRWRSWTTSGAILVIAVFYTSDLSWTSLGVAVLLLGVIMAMLKGGMRNPLSYIVMALCFRGAVHESGVHASRYG